MSQALALPAQVLEAPVQGMVALVLAEGRNGEVGILAQVVSVLACAKEVAPGAPVLGTVA